MLRKQKETLHKHGLSAARPFNADIGWAGPAVPLLFLSSQNTGLTTEVAKARPSHSQRSQARLQTCPLAWQQLALTCRDAHNLLTASTDSSESTEHEGVTETVQLKTLLAPPTCQSQS